MFELSQVAAASIFASIGIVNLVIGILLAESWRRASKENPPKENGKRQKQNMLEQERKIRKKDLQGKNKSFHGKNSPPEDLAGLITKKESEKKNRENLSTEYVDAGTAERSKQDTKESTVKESARNESGEDSAVLYLIKGRDEEGNLILTEEGIISNRLAEEGAFKVGGKKTSDYIVKNDYISGTHAVISKHGGRYYIMDISRNGTRISAVPYRKERDPMMYPLVLGKEEELLDGTLIELAKKVELLFRCRKG